MSDLARDNLIDEIMQFALGDLVTWSEPLPLRNIGPAYPEEFKKFTEMLEAFKADLRTHLRMLTLHELQNDFPHTTTPAFNLLFDTFGRAGHLARRLARLKKKRPMDYVGGWAIQGREVDQPHWRSMARYSLAEAAMLSLGRDPRKTTFAAVMKHYGRSDPGDRVLYFLEDRYNAIADGLGLDRNDEDSMIDADRFYGWIDAFSVSVDERFRRMFNERRKRLADVAAKRPVQPSATVGRIQEKPLHGTSAQTHAKIVVTIAMQKYGLVGASDIGRVVKAIQAAGDLLGLSVDRKVITGLLKNGLAALTQANEYDS